MNLKHYPTVNKLHLYYSAIQFNSHRQNKACIATQKISFENETTRSSLQVELFFQKMKPIIKEALELNALSYHWGVSSENPATV